MSSIPVFRCRSARAPLEQTGKKELNVKPGIIVQGACPNAACAQFRRRALISLGFNLSKRQNATCPSCQARILGLSGLFVYHGLFCIEEDGLCITFSRELTQNRLIGFDNFPSLRILKASCGDCQEEDAAFSSTERSECIPPRKFDLPLWRRVSCGICVEGECLNVHCVASGRRVLYNHGFRRETKCWCPCCNTAFEPLSSLETISNSKVLVSSKDCIGFRPHCQSQFLCVVETILQHVVGFLEWKELACFLRVTRAANSKDIWKRKLDHCYCIRGICIARAVAKMEDFSPLGACHILATTRTRDSKVLLAKLRDDDLYTKPERALLKAGCWLLLVHKVSTARAFFTFLVSQPVLLKDLWKLRMLPNDEPFVALQAFLASSEGFGILKAYCAWITREWKTVASYESLGEEYSFIKDWCCVAYWHLRNFDKSIECGKRTKKNGRYFPVRYSARSHVLSGRVPKARRLLQTHGHPSSLLELAWLEAHVGNLVQAQAHLHNALQQQLPQLPFDWRETIETVCKLTE